MINFAVSLISGIAAFHFSPFFPFSIITLCILTIAFFLFRSVVKSRPNAEKKKIILIIFFFVFGFFYSFIRQDIPLEIRIPDTDVYVEGTVMDVPEMSEGKLRFTLGQVYLEGEKIRGKVKLVLAEEYYIDDIPEILPVSGDRISALTRIREPGMLHNQHVYSYDLKKDGVVAAGYIKQMKIVGRESGLQFRINRKRHMLGRVIDNSLSRENASLLRAIIPGLKKGIGQDMRDAFSSTGLAHLLSISGTHFGLLAFIIFKVVRMLVKLLPVRALTGMTLYITPTQAAIIITLPVLVLYALISGLSTPTVRSLIMVAIYMLALFLGRRGQWLNSLSIAAIIILLWRPDTLFDLSFVLSFLAVLSIGCFLEMRETGRSQNEELPGDIVPLTGPERLQPFTRVFEKVKTAVFITISAVFGTAPMVALYFKQFSLISPFSNLVVTPVICFVLLPLGFVTGFIALLFGMNTMPLNGLTDIVAHLSLSLIKGFSVIPYSNFHVPDPSFILTVFYFISLLIIIKSRLKLRFLPVIIVICVYMAGPFVSSEKIPMITFLDVGQGESSLVQLPDKKVMLVDGGTKSPDMGRRVIAPYLWSKGIKQIDFLILSHAHPDHYGGLIYIMDNFQIREIWLNSRRIPSAGDFFNKVREKNISIRVLKRGDVLEADGYKLYVLHPYDEFFAGSPRGEFADQNNDSLVLKIETGSVSVLFTGDIDAEAEENLIYLGKWLKSDIIKVPHHGGRSSSSEKFIEAVSPEIAVISVGKNNPFNHPNGDTLERYKNADVKIFRTDIDGAVTITPGDVSYNINTYWDSRFRKVHVLSDELENFRLLM